MARFLALESAGQCGPCFNGLPRIAAAMDEIARPRPDPRAVTDMLRWAALVQGRGACHHPDGSVRFIRSALHVFRDEITNHGQGRVCGPGAAAVPAAARRHRAERRGLELTGMKKQLRVDPTVCSGHGLCAELLPELITLDEWGYPYRG